MVLEHEGEIVEAGIYTWFLAEDRLFGDTLVAALFGLSAQQAICGLPLAAYLARVQREDRDRVSRLIRQAVMDGEPYHAEYHVLNASGHEQQVIAMGRCFRDESGNPFVYSGIIYPIDQLEEAGQRATSGRSGGEAGP